MIENTLFITGAAGFIGSSFLRLALTKNYNCVVIDKLTYAGRKENIQDLMKSQNNVTLEIADIADFEKIKSLFYQHKPSAIVHLAAESHVDNSISGPKVFIDTNIQGTFSLLEASRDYFSKLHEDQKRKFKFVHISTDEVFGELGETGKFSETTPYAPNSPYSSSKAASDMIVRAWHRTYGLPTVVTNCSNNYGPRQFPEKLIPKVILNALSGKAIPVYGAGQNVRDWIHVEDHCQGVMLALRHGTPGKTYCFGGDSERKNIDVVKTICQILDRKRPLPDQKSYTQFITFVEDRLGHDARYAIDDSFAQKELGFTRKYTSFEKGLESTIDWYLDNSNWVTAVQSKGAF